MYKIKEAIGMPIKKLAISMLKMLLFLKWWIMSENFT